MRKKAYIPVEEIPSKTTSVPVSTRLKTSTKKVLERIAKEKRQSLANVISIILDNYVEHISECADSSSR